MNEDAQLAQAIAASLLISNSTSSTLRSPPTSFPGNMTHTTRINNQQPTTYTTQPADNPRPASHQQQHPDDLVLAIALRASLHDLPPLQIHSKPLPPDPPRHESFDSDDSLDIEAEEYELTRLESLKSLKEHQQKKEPEAKMYNQEMEMAKEASLRISSLSTRLITSDEMSTEGSDMAVVISGEGVGVGGNAYGVQREQRVSKNRVKKNCDCLDCVSQRSIGGGNTGIIGTSSHQNLHRNQPLASPIPLHDRHSATPSSTISNQSQLQGSHPIPPPTPMSPGATSTSSRSTISIPRDQSQGYFSADHHPQHCDHNYIHQYSQHPYHRQDPANQAGSHRNHHNNQHHSDPQYQANHKNATTSMAHIHPIPSTPTTPTISSGNGCHTPSVTSTLSSPTSTSTSTQIRTPGPGDVPTPIPIPFPISSKTSLDSLANSFFADSARSSSSSTRYLPHHDGYLADGCLPCSQQPQSMLVCQNCIDYLDQPHLHSHDNFGDNIGNAAETRRMREVTARKEGTGKKVEEWVRNKIDQVGSGSGSRNGSGAEVGQDKGKKKTTFFVR